MNVEAKAAHSAPVEHLYIHVPFCAAKCNYCAFYSKPGSTAKRADYVDALLIEFERFAPQLSPTTIFFGGGTPSLLPAPLIRPVLEAVGRARPPGAPIEWTIECNPGTVSTEKARLYREFGVNRISLGVQAFDDELLKSIGRIHSVKSARDSYNKFRAVGFENINLDLMFGLPGQTLERFRESLRQAIELEPEHISTYCLILEEDTEFWSLVQKGMPLPDEQQQLAMYETAIETLSAAGYQQYEISNFAKPGQQCAHNIAYWTGKDYIGLGPSACSTVGNRRWQNVADTDRYIAAMCSRGCPQPQSAFAYEETLTPELRAAERAAFGMRMLEGVPADLLRGRWDNQIAELLSAELVHWRDGRLAPTKRGVLFADDIAAEFV